MTSAGRHTGSDLLKPAINPQLVTPIWLVIITGIVLLMMIVFLVSSGHQLRTVYLPLVQATNRMALSTTRGHLWLEESLSGDSQVSSDEVWSYLDDTEWYLQAMQQGGSSELGVYRPLADSELTRRIEDLRIRFQRFREIAQARWSEGAGTGVGTTSDQQLDEAYEAFTKEAASAEDYLHRLIARQQSADETVLITLAVLITLMVGTTAWQFIVYYRRLAQDYRQLAQAKEEIALTNEELEAQYEEISAINNDLLEVQAVIQQSEKKFRNMIHSSPMGMHFYELTDDDRLIFRDVNDAANRILQFDCHQLIGQTIEEAFPPLTATEVPTRYRAAARDGIPWWTEQVTYEDERITGAFEVWAFQTEANRMAVFFQDVTPRKRAEAEIQRKQQELEGLNEELAASNEELEALNTELAATNEQLSQTNSLLRRTEDALRENAALLLSVAGNIQAIIFATDTQGTITFSQGRGLAALGLAPGEAVGGDAFAAYRDHPHLADGLRRALTGELFDGIMELPDRVFEVYLAPVRNLQGQVTGSAGLAIDITERRVAISALYDSETTLRSIVRSAPVGIGLVIDRVLLRANERLCQIVGYTEDELLGQNARMLYPTDEDFEWVGREKYKQIAERGTGTVETRFRRKDGTIIDVLLSSTPLNAADLSQGVTFTALDITDRKRAEQEITRLRNRLQNIVDSMPSVLITVDRLGRISQCNHEAESFTGLPFAQAAGQPLTAVYPMLAGISDLVGQVIGSGTRGEAPRLAVADNGANRFFDVAVYPLQTSTDAGAVIRIDDVTERVRLEELMIQAEKLQSVGSLAAGMAHEINNPLAGILQNTQVLVNRLSAGSAANQQAAAACGLDLQALASYIEARELDLILKAVLDSGERAARIVENMLSFSRKSCSQITPVRLGLLVDETLELVSNDYDLKKRYDFRRIKIVREYAEHDELTVPGDRTKIQQVILNLLKNSAQAMVGFTRNGFSPQITIRLYQESSMARLEIEDNGPGMDETTQRRVFEPFFTTKAVGEGTGLGLSVSYFIITENHHGTLSVESNPGQGARFVVRLPLKRTEQ